MILIYLHALVTQKKLKKNTIFPTLFSHCMCKFLFEVANFRFFYSIAKNHPQKIRIHKLFICFE